MSSTLTVLGKGTMGSAMADLAQRAGASVQTLDGSDADTAVTGDLVVLAVPHAAVAGIVSQRREQRAGKVVVDITNPLDFDTFSLTVPVDSSSAARIAEALPTARVLKAFNTNFGATLATGGVEGQPTTVLIAGDDEQAKGLAKVVNTAGLRTADVGPLARARELEALALLQIGLAATGQTSWTGGFALHA